MGRVLVVDDDEGVRSFLVEALEDAGHAVRSAHDVPSALAVLAKARFELVLTDLKMPGPDGMTLVRHLRAEHAETEVVVLTARGTVETAVEAMKLGAYDFLQKPLASPAELRLMAERALERHALRAHRERTERMGEGADPPLSYGDATMGAVVELLRKVARVEATVLLLGESGTGKELAARAVHQWSPRAQGPFVAINGAALSASLLESELFGHEKGAFTGAHAQRRGRVELAERGSFFLDEVGELRTELQAKLLRVLQERTFERVGGTRTLEADVRWIAATNADLSAMVHDGAFREDLYHRLAVFPVRIPPLRERPDDVVPLARWLLERVGNEVSRPGLRFDAGAEARLRAARWPGNVRELRNVIERAVVLIDGAQTRVRAEDLWIDAPGPAGAGTSARASVRPPAGTSAAAASVGGHDGLRLESLEREAITKALAEEHGNRRRAAERLGIGLRTLYEKLKRFGL